MDECEVDGCTLPVRSTGMCNLHRQRKRTHGDPNIVAFNREIHGLRHTLIYEKWKGMKQRCGNPKNSAYKNYGARGISVCDAWINSFVKFYEHVSKLEHFGEPGYTLDRINNDGNYEPGNIKWSTRKEQNLNQRRNK